MMTANSDMFPWRMDATIEVSDGSVTVMNYESVIIFCKGMHYLIS